MRRAPSRTLPAKAARAFLRVTGARCRADRTGGAEGYVDILRPPDSVTAFVERETVALERGGHAVDG